VIPLTGLFCVYTLTDTLNVVIYAICNYCLTGPIWNVTYFKQWRKAMGFDQVKAASKLGKSLRTIGMYDRNEIEVSVSVKLAMSAVEAGLGEWQNG
jgi:hypothetical protein